MYTKEQLCRMEQPELVKLIDEGRLVYLPCKVGDIVYQVSSRGGINSLIVPNFHTIIRWIEDKVFGVIIFPTLPEAEKALKEMELSE